jgi:hypothetical protein
MQHTLTRVYTVQRVIQTLDNETDLVAISIKDNNGRFEQQTFFKPKDKKWDYECDRLERMAVKLLIHNLMMK